MLLYHFLLYFFSFFDSLCHTCIWSLLICKDKTNKQKTNTHTHTHTHTHILLYIFLSIDLEQASVEKHHKSTVIVVHDFWLYQVFRSHAKTLYGAELNWIFYSPNSFPPAVAVKSHLHSDMTSGYVYMYTNSLIIGINQRAMHIIEQSI